MDLDHAARCLEKLGHPTRLRIIRLLVRAGPDGLSVGAVKEHLGIPASTLSHHIVHLVSAGLIGQERRGRILRCTANYPLLDSVVTLLTEECCTGLTAVRKRAG